MSRISVTPHLMTVFQRYGYEGATMDQLGEVNGLKKSSLYRYFPGGKEEMAAEALDYFTHILQEHLLEPLESDRTPLSRLRAMNQNIYKFYQQGRQNCLLSSLNIGTTHELFQERLEIAIELWIDSLESLLVTVGITPITARQRAEEAIALIQGALILARGLNDTGTFKRILDRIPGNLLRPE
jgi:TetR/AcrR family transcriptional regulator, lmrAB and yxaGH operons repressor